MSQFLIITGGSRGIGEKTIACFLDQGWSVINISRSSCHLPGVINVNIDLSSAKNIAIHTESLQAAIQHATTIALVHNAAFYQIDSVDTLSLTDLQRALETNLISCVALNQIIIPFMTAGSSIIYIGSTLSEIGVPGRASYIISKHALVGLMRATCQDLADKLITTCCICPGFVDTHMLRDVVDETSIKQLVNSRVLGKRLIAPAEIADIVYFCATHPVINGEVIHANLGQVMS